LLSRSSHSATLNGQRWSVDLRIDRRDQLTSDGKLVLAASWNTRTKTEKRPDEKYPRMFENVEDASIEGWFPGPGWLVAACFANRTEAAKINSRWAVWFDAQGNAVAGTVVTFAVATGGGSVISGRQTTDAAGVAEAGGWFLGQTPGANTLTASHIHEGAVGVAGPVVTNFGPEAVYTRTGNTLRATFRGVTHGGAQRTDVYRVCCAWQL
jgi:hypothetical protein